MIGADRWLKRLSRGYLRHKWQRLKRGYSDFDMWNADGYLADVISATAYWHFVHNHGFDPFYGEERWLENLLEIYDGFKRDDDDMDWQPPAMAWDLLREMFPSLWD